MSKTVVIVGASSGIGRATAHAFARKGYRLGLVARNELALNETLREVYSLGGSGIVVPMDASDASSVEEAASRIEAALGAIDIWVNNAMVSMMAPFDEMSAEEFEQITRVTYLSYVWGTKEALKRMKKRDRGVIVQVGSALAHRSIPLQSAYCGAKHAIVGFTESVRCELLHDRSQIKITVVHLPGVNTPQFNWVRSRMEKKPKPVGTIFQPEAAARAIVWASENPRKEVLFGFPTLESVIGNRVAPALLDHYLARKVYRDHFSEELEDSLRPNNLFEAVAVDYGVHGPYSKLAKKRSLEFAISKNRSWLLSVGAIAIGLLFSLRQVNAKELSHG